MVGWSHDRRWCEKCLQSNGKTYLTGREWLGEFNFQRNRLERQRRGRTVAMNSGDIVAISGDMIHDHVLRVDHGESSLLV
jgi:hypothetical protein